MTDLHNTEVPVTSTPGQYKSIAPSIFFGLPGAFFQVRNAQKRGLTDTARYWKAAAISTVVGFVASFLLLAASIALIAAVVSKAPASDAAVTGNNDGTSQSAVDTTAASDPAVIAYNNVVAPADIEEPFADLEKDKYLIITNLYANRTEAYCKGDPSYLPFIWDSGTNQGYQDDYNTVQSIAAGTHEKACGDPTLGELTIISHNGDNAVMDVVVANHRVLEHYTTTLHFTDGRWKWVSIPRTS